MCASEVKSDRDLLKLMLKTAMLAVVVQSLFEMLFRPKVVPGSFDLEPKGWAYFVRMAMVIALFELGPTFYAVSSHSLDMRRTLRVAMVLIMTVPLIAGGLWLQLIEFSAVTVDQGGVKLRGASLFANGDYQFNQLDEVVLRKGLMSDVLLFRWYDKIHQSCWIYHFDDRATSSLHVLVKKLEESGLKVVEEIEGE